jgi:hypothetical protein
MLTINNIKPSQVEDSWICVIGSDVEFTVKNGYVFLSENFLPHTNLYPFGMPDFEVCLGKSSTYESQSLLLATNASTAAYSGEFGKKRGLYVAYSSSMWLVFIGG